MTAFPASVDPAITSDPGQTLDQADHTNLHNVLSSGMHEVQALLGPRPTANEPVGKTMRQRLLDVESAVVEADPILGVSATSLPAGSNATATWNAGASTIAFGIPRGATGADGADGKDGVTAKGIISNTKLTPIKAGTIVGLDISFPSAFAAIPVVVCTPIQDTVGQGAAGTTTGTITSTVVAGRWKTYIGSGAVKPSGDSKPNIIYHGYWDGDYDNQRGIVCFPDIKALFPKGAVATSVKLELTTGTEQASADQLTVHPHSASTPPSTMPDPGSSQYFRYAPSGGLAKGAKFTLDLTSKNWGSKFIDGSYASLVLGPERNTSGGLNNTQSTYGGIQATTVKLIIVYSVTNEAPVTNIDSVPVDVGVRNVTKSGFRLVVRNSNQSDESVRIGWMAS